VSLRGGSAAIAVAGLLALSAGCTPKGSELRAELLAGSRPGCYIALKFIRQEPNRCGSAALSEVLTHWGAERASEEQLAAEVYSQSLKGSLNIDLAAAAVRRDMVTREGASTLSELRTLLAAGCPAVVMINVGPYVLNRKHFLAMKGVDLERGYLMADNGRREDIVLRARPFRRDWRASKFWALYCWPAGSAPKWASGKEDLRAGVILEKRGSIPAARAAYRRALDKNAGLWEAEFNLGNVALAAGDLVLAERHYRSAMKLQPAESDVLNNLAWVLLQRRADMAEAEKLARAAVKAASDQSVARVRARHTLGVVLIARGEEAAARSELRLALDEARKLKKPELAAAVQTDLDKLK
jgi:tetratricopeptide (TPR) repeat protein